MPEGPDSSDGAEKGALAHARRSGQERTLAALERETHVCDQRLTVWSVELHAIHDQAPTISVGVVNADLRRRLGVREFEGALETRKSYDHGAPCSNICVGGDDDA